MIQKLILILLVASTYQISNASELNSPVSFATLEEAEMAYEELNLEVEELLEEIELLEGEDAEEASFTKGDDDRRRRRRRRRRRNRGTCSAGNPVAATVRGSGSQARARAVSLCNMRGGKQCTRVRCSRF